MSRFLCPLGDMEGSTKWKKAWGNVPHPMDTFLWKYPGRTWARPKTQLKQCISFLVLDMHLD